MLKRVPNVCINTVPVSKVSVPLSLSHAQEDILEQLNFDELNITSTDDDILDENEAAGISAHTPHTHPSRTHTHPLTPLTSHEYTTPNPIHTSHVTYPSLGFFLGNGQSNSCM